MPRHVQRPFPRDDIDFVALVDAIALDATTPAELERRLRVTHPQAVVRSRDLEGEQIQVWYVYRDGSWNATQE